MRGSGGYGRRTGWRAVFDPDAWSWTLLVVTVWVVFLSALACAVALVRDTTGHDWYATGKLTLTELMIGIGFDESARTEYRTSRDEVLSLTRVDLTYNGNALLARWRVLRTARRGAELGACCGLGGAVLWFWLIVRRNRGQARLPAREPPVRPPESQAQGKVQRPPATERDPGKGAGKSGERHKRRKRDYKRWI
ncbi:MAG: hypothetical protein OXQ29_14895 [Rhodospirillaceae bacterium]|nr:hypothetical protein [Rhodospirillaceae bacterium]